MIGVMNNTKWDELRLAMYQLGALSPRWRTKDRQTGYISEWDGEWFYHFRCGGYDTIEWVELKIESAPQRDSVREILRQVHVPGRETDAGFCVYGWVQAEKQVEYVG